MASTYKAILARVAQTAVAKATIQLSTKVTSVQSIEKAAAEGPRVSVTTEKETLEYDEVVITSPLGCLKRGLPAISPSPPHGIFRAIANISYGHLEKVFITFPAAFWDPPSDKTAVTGSSKVSEFPFFSHFLHPLYSPENPESWNVEMASLASVFPAEVLHPTLLFYIHGPCATHVTNLITALQPSSPEYFSRLNSFFRPYYSRLPNFCPESEVCTPTGILATDWQHDELAGFGSYTNFQISPPVKEGEEEVQFDKDIEALREGMPERGIWFAGEHTAPFVALGTVTGAYWSGESVGKRIGVKYGLEEGDGEVNGGEERSKVKVGKGVVIP